MNFRNTHKHHSQSMTVELPILISHGLDDATEKFNLNRSDIVRSVLYDFLISAGILPENESLNRPEDEYVESIGRLPILLNIGEVKC